MGTFSRERKGRLVVETDVRGMVKLVGVMVVVILSP